MNFRILKIQGRSTYQIPYFFSFLYSVEMFKMGRRK